ncbi:MAG TPA: SIMPL domain-containing protein [Candidatus Nanoarchaeia archaeon]|nr:SIMPL domain-containing protein [Candidatus Nanoarchaeia archaeon]
MHKSVQITLIIVLGVLILAGLGFYTISSFSPFKRDTISVTGNSKVEAMPDIVTVYFNVQTSGKTTEEASQKNSEIVDSLVNGLLAEGFLREDIQTENFNIYPEYEWINGKRQDKGFTAVHSIKLKMPASETDKIGKSVDIGAKAGASINYINFELSQEKQNDYKAEAMKLAAEDAKIKAEAVAEGLGKEVGKLVSVSVDQFDYYPWRIYETAGAGFAEEAMLAKEAATGIQPGEKEISAQVSAVFKIK